MNATTEIRTCECCPQVLGPYDRGMCSRCEARDAKLRLRNLMEEVDELVELHGDPIRTLEDAAEYDRTLAPYRERTAIHAWMQASEVLVERLREYLEKHPAEAGAKGESQ